MRSGSSSGGRPGRPDHDPGRGAAAWALRHLIRAAGDTRPALARRLGIGTTDAAALDHLVAATEPLGPVELGQRLGITSASATILVDRLVRAGHVRRAPHPTDRRRLVLELTDRAVDEVVAELRPMLDGIARAAARLTPEQAAATVGFLREVTEVMRAYSAEACSRTDGATRSEGSGPASGR